MQCNRTEHMYVHVYVYSYGLSYGLTLARAVRCCHISTISFLCALLYPLSFSSSESTASLCLASFVLSALFSLWILSPWKQ